MSANQIDKHCINYAYTLLLPETLLKREEIDVVRERLYISEQEGDYLRSEVEQWVQYDELMVAHSFGIYKEPKNVVTNRNLKKLTQLRDMELRGLIKYECEYVTIPSLDLQIYEFFRKEEPKPEVPQQPCINVRAGLEPGEKYPLSYYSNYVMAKAYLARVKDRRIWDTRVLLTGMKPFIRGRLIIPGDGCGLVGSVAKELGIDFVSTEPSRVMRMLECDKCICPVCKDPRMRASMKVVSRLVCRCKCTCKNSHILPYDFDTTLQKYSSGVTYFLSHILDYVPHAMAALSAKRIRFLSFEHKRYLGDQGEEKLHNVWLGPLGTVRTNIPDMHMLGTLSISRRVRYEYDAIFSDTFCKTRRYKFYLGTEEARQYTKMFDNFNVFTYLGIGGDEGLHKNVDSPTLHVVKTGYLEGFLPGDFIFNVVLRTEITLDTVRKSLSFLSPDRKERFGVPREYCTDEENMFYTGVYFVLPDESLVLLDKLNHVTRVRGRKIDIEGEEFFTYPPIKPLTSVLYNNLIFKPNAETRGDSKYTLPLLYTAQAYIREYGDAVPHPKGEVISHDEEDCWYVNRSELLPYDRVHMEHPRILEDVDRLYRFIQGREVKLPENKYCFDGSKIYHNETYLSLFQTDDRNHVEEVIFNYLRRFPIESDWSTAPGWMKKFKDRQEE
jgi:hypothetical protein